MRRHSSIGALLALVFALGSLIATASPAAAETIFQDCVGTCGSWQVEDTGPTGRKGVVCVFGTSGQSLDRLVKITVRPPQMHGAYPNKTKVAWRFRIRHKANGGTTWSVISTAAYQAAKADDAIPAYAGHGFSRGAWNAPSNPHGFWQVLIDMQWWKAGSVEGTVRLRYTWYKAIRGSATHTNNYWCEENF